METGRKVGDPSLSSPFKSYYVVWKLSSQGFASQKTCLFKSYYVVWKLNITQNEIHGEILFKSYYVVWKHRK